MQTDAPTTGELVAELRALLAKATPGPWEHDSILDPDAEYGAGPDPDRGFSDFEIYGADGLKILGTENSAHKEIEEDRADEDGYFSAWDRIGRANAMLTVAAVNALPTVLNALETQGAHEGVIEALGEHDDRVAVDTLSAAMKECRRVRDETTFADTVPEDERRALRNGADACWHMLNGMQGEILKRHGIRLPERLALSSGKTVSAGEG